MVCATGTEIGAQPGEVVLSFHYEGPRLNQAAWKAALDLLGHLSSVSLLLITKKLTTVNLAIL